MVPAAVDSNTATDEHVVCGSRTMLAPLKYVRATALAACPGITVAAVVTARSCIISTATDAADMTTAAAATSWMSRWQLSLDQTPKDTPSTHAAGSTLMSVIANCFVESRGLYTNKNLRAYQITRPEIETTVLLSILPMCVTVGRMRL